MSDVKTYDVPADWAKRAFVDDARYQAMYEASQKEAAEADAKADAAKDSDVVDADFEEIDEDDDKKKSA